MEKCRRVLEIAKGLVNDCMRINCMKDYYGFLIGGPWGAGAKKYLFKECEIKFVLQKLVRLETHVCY